MAPQRRTMTAEILPSQLIQPIRLNRQSPLGILLEQVADFVSRSVAQRTIARDKRIAPLGPSINADAVGRLARPAASFSHVDLHDSGSCDFLRWLLVADVEEELGHLLLPSIDGFRPQPSATRQNNFQRTIPVFIAHTSIDDEHQVRVLLAPPTTTSPHSIHTVDRHEPIATLQALHGRGWQW